MNNKGFTLIELIVTIVLLAVMLSIGAFSVISLVNNSKQRNYGTLIKSIKAGVESYAIECTYAKNSDITCASNRRITLGKLVEYGFLSGNEKDTDKKYTIINPKDNKSIANCNVQYDIDANGKVTVKAITTTGSCPKTCEYAGTC